MSRCARLANLSQDELAEQSKVSKRTIVNFESGQTSPNASTLELLKRTLEAAGVEFIPENAVAPE